MMTHLIDDLPALGTRWWIEIEQRGGDMSALAVRLREIISSFESDYSRFRPESYVSRLNSGESIARPPHDLVMMLTYAQTSYRQTRGAFDITVAPHLVRHGYGDSREPSTHSGVTPLDISLTPHLIRLPPGATIDLGGIGKGYLIDLLASHLRDAGRDTYLINGGGDLRIRSLHDPISITIEHPLRPGYTLGSIAARDYAICVSSPTRRTWQSQGTTYSHLISPTQPDEYVSCGSIVIGSDCLTADIWATTLCVSPDMMSAVPAGHEYMVIDSSMRAMKSPGWGRMVTKA